MSKLTSADFVSFFEEIWGYKPFPWQRRLLDDVLDNDWPEYIAVPTASGKTASLDVAVFTLALQAALRPEERTVGRRIFFIVNRRVIVDEAYERAEMMAKALLDAKKGVVLQVAEALRKIGGDSDAPPLDVALMRGGIVNDNRWVRDITQPTIITSTIDQVGSRLLFRGYGVSDAAKPLHAALVAHDSLLILDEAHISQPFVETLNAVKRYRGGQWAEKPVNTPFAFVQMTATPGASEGWVLRLDDEDRTHSVLQKRHAKSKPVTLHEAAKAPKGKQSEVTAKELAERAVELLSIDDGRRNIAIIANRIATARKAHALLPDLLRKAKKPDCDVFLAIGRMRPIDRDTLTKAIQARVGKDAEEEKNSKPMFVVATQCLEVGADFDFDGMVSECASLDALRQRFGRMNRQGRDIETRGAIVIRADQVKDEDDPIYGLALAKTWAWLNEVAKDKHPEVDFGVNAMDDILKEADISALLAPKTNAPVMFPAYVDAWAQTHPMPAPDPDVSLFLHGLERGEPDVQVCWREDIALDDEEDIVQAVSLCPPSSPECMSVPIGLVRNWLMGADVDDSARSDVLDAKSPELDESGRKGIKEAVLWRGPDRSCVIKDPGDIKPGDTIVLPVSLGGGQVLGHVPDDAPADIAEEAHEISRDRLLFRLRPERLEGMPASEALDQLREWLRDRELNLKNRELQNLLKIVASSIPDQEDPLASAMRILGKGDSGFEYERYAGQPGAVMWTRRRLKRRSVLPAMDEGDDLPSRISRREPVPLTDHLQHVVNQLEKALTLIPLTDTTDALRAAAAMHDWGKADERFQAMLLNADRNDAWAQSVLWAKSGVMPANARSRRRAYERSGLPSGFRHEMLSVQVAEQAVGRLPKDPAARDLALHLIAAHHGHARPFAPVVMEQEAPDVTLKLAGFPVTLSAEYRMQNPPHRLDSGIAERFWNLTHRYGWWGLAYFEAIIRLADQRASQREDASMDEETPAEAKHAENAS